ncbi:UreF-domain-containing protein [Biscogniauxia mediterranea]|nr:UreF-domain-containing protein [Biscogniauxia mediterranea]
MSPVTDEGSQQELENEIAALESRLASAKHRLREKSKAAISSHRGGLGGGDDDAQSPPPPPPNPPPPRAPVATDAAHHYLLLLSDSALPLGSFAFSSGLESYLAHGRQQQQHTSTSTSTSTPPPSFASFLPLALSSYARTSLPFVLAAHRDPSPGALASLDDALDATMICTVGRRGSVAQGRALLSIWEKSLGPAAGCSSSSALAPFAALLRTSSSSLSSSSSPETEGEEQLLPPPVSAHLAPLFGAVAALLGLTARQAAYVFLLSHAKALVSAAVRAGCFGPYRAQSVLAGPALRDALGDAVAREWRTPVEDAGQRVPVMDLWVGRHELLYSRIFNS